MTQYTLECGFLHHIVGIIFKVQEQHFFYALVLFCCLKILVVDSELKGRIQAAFMDMIANSEIVVI